LSCRVRRRSLFWYLKAIAYAAYCAQTRAHGSPPLSSPVSSTRERPRFCCPLNSLYPKRFSSGICDSAPCLDFAKTSSSSSSLGVNAFIIPCSIPLVNLAGRTTAMPRDHRPSGHPWSAPSPPPNRHRAPRSSTPPTGESATIAAQAALLRHRPLRCSPAAQRRSGNVDPRIPPGPQRRNPENPPGGRCLPAGQLGGSSRVVGGATQVVGGGGMAERTPKARAA